MKMKNYKAFAALLTMLMIFGCAAMISAQTNAFTYQGQLNDGAATANGTYQMQFSLYDAATGGNQIGATITNGNVSVVSGVFTVSLDFSPAAPFAAGADRFLQVAVKKPADAAYTTLAPRQQITSSPYSLRTVSAQTSDALSASCVGCVTNAQIAAVDGSKVTGGTVTNLNASNLSTGTVPLARLGTNTPTAAKFLRGDNTWVAGGLGATLEVSATNTAAQTITPLAGSTSTQNVSFNNIITAPTAGTFDGTTFTATTAGTYLVTAAVTAPEGVSNGIYCQLAVNGITVTTGPYGFYSSGASNFNRGASLITMTLALNANDTVLIRGQSFSSTAAAPVSTSGTTRLAIVKLN